MRYFKTILFCILSLRPGVYFMFTPHLRRAVILQGLKSLMSFAGLDSVDDCFTWSFCCRDKTPRSKTA